MGIKDYSEDVSVKNPYEELASAIVVQACKDYTGGRLSDHEFKRFCYSQWFKMLTSIEGSYLFKRMYRKVRGRSYDGETASGGN